MSSNQQFIVEIKNFQEYKKLIDNNENLPVFFHFFTDWCGPCKRLAIILDAKMNELKGKLYLGKINLDENEDLGVEFDISNIPFCQYYKNRIKIHEFVGINKETLKDIFDNL